MTHNEPKIVYLKDYAVYPFEIKEVKLTFKLSSNSTRVISHLTIKPKENYPTNNMFLHGELLVLIWCKINGVFVEPELVSNGLNVKVPNSEFIFECEVELDPAKNTFLEGLYISEGMYCTQCEAEGFRKITYYPDRPDVLSRFKVRIETQGQDLPILLSNGNPAGSGPGWAEWIDPWPKPAYLFALVAGQLINHKDYFKTKKGKIVTLNIWVRSGDEDKCAFAMKALKASMKWDEQTYDREYDLDIFNIVAVDDFNMGAMENKGLNIFNSSCVLANLATSTDSDFERIEAIIAHEYFHNWTGNRITCRDWFQLSLKEGLTVYRDAQFTSDMRSASVKRIQDANMMRTHQFQEDNGPLSHPVRPDSFVEINNFYTLTVYEKGAEVVGMLKRLVGDEAYYKALSLYFKRHDGNAATIEDWLKVFEDTTGRDLGQFKRWYSQAGTPRLSLSETYKNGTLTLNFTQKTLPTVDQPEKQDQVIPIAVGLLDENGYEILPTTVLEMTKSTQSFSFYGFDSKPIASVLRDFSAPVYLDQPMSDEKRAFLMKHDTDPFNRWDAANKLIRDCLILMSIQESSPTKNLIEALLSVLTDHKLDPAFRALILRAPSQSNLAAEIAENGKLAIPEKIYEAHERFSDTIAYHMSEALREIYLANQVTEAYEPTAEQSSSRVLANTVLDYISRFDGGETAKLQYANATNMTQQLAALGALLRNGIGQSELDDFYSQWASERLVIDKWFGIQISTVKPSNLFYLTKKLTKHSDFNINNPNRFRSIFGNFIKNFAGFHHKSGSGYALLTDWLIMVDKFNPQLAARMCGAFQEGPFDENRKSLIKSNLARMLQTNRLSVDTKEIVTRLNQG